MAEQDPQSHAQPFASEPSHPSARLHVAARDTAASPRPADQALRYEELFRIAPTACVVTDDHDTIIDANQAAEALLGREGASATGQALVGFAPPEQRGRLTALQAAARGEPGLVAVADDVRVRVADRDVPLSVHCRAIGDHPAEVSGFCWVLHDLGGVLEAERVDRQAKAAEAARFRELAQHWERLDSAKSQFLSVTAHELRSPVTVLGGYLSLLDAGTFGQLPAPVERVVTVMVGKTHELNDLVNDMLETARIDDERTVVHVSRVDVGELVARVVDEWRPLTPPEQGLDCWQPEKPVIVDADPGRLRTIVTNLVSNAIKYSPGGGDITCTVSSSEGTAFISVADSGLGIPAVSMDVLFTRFGRVVTPETMPITGTGLGLYIARELARIHGGDITVSSREHEGSVFTVALPLRT